MIAARRIQFAHQLQAVWFDAQLERPASASDHAQWYMMRCCVFLLQFGVQGTGIHYCLACFRHMAFRAPYRAHEL